MDFFHQLDVLAYRMVVEVWALFWPVLLAICILAPVERRFGREKHQLWRAWRFNLLWHLGLLVLVVTVSWTAWTEFVDWLGTFGGRRQWRLAAPDGSWELAARVALALLVHDFFAYWSHRLQHAVPAIWAMHQFHHDERHMNASTSLRAHWINLPYVQVLVLVPMMWLLGFDVMTPAVYVVHGLFVAYTHMNVDIGHGKLSKLLVSPRYHRIHHASERYLHDSNYANILPLWDIVFRTHTAPGRTGVEGTGLDYMPSSASFITAFFQPLVDWAHMLRRAVART